MSTANDFNAGREEMWKDVLVMSERAAYEAHFTTPNHADDLRRFALECREFAREIENKGASEL